VVGTPGGGFTGAPGIGVAVADTGVGVAAVGVPPAGAIEFADGARADEPPLHAASSDETRITANRRK
jgi:hypothetical protein